MSPEELELIQKLKEQLILLDEDVIKAKIAVITAKDNKIRENEINQLISVVKNSCKVRFQIKTIKSREKHRLYQKRKAAREREILLSPSLPEKSHRARL